MQEEELVKLVRQVQQQRRETLTFEVKSASQGCPTKLFATLSSFSNQDDGGTILFGLNEKHNFEVVGVNDPQNLQS